jgi:hypothetical protein
MTAQHEVIHHARILETRRVVQRSLGAAAPEACNKVRYIGSRIGQSVPETENTVPGRGYWAKLAVGNPVRRLPLREFKNAPNVRRLKMASTPKPTLDSTDPELAQIAAVESKPIALKIEQHKVVALSEGRLRRARTDKYGIIEPPTDKPCVRIRVSKELLDRALTLMSTILFALEDNGFQVNVNESATSVRIFGQDVKFSIVEDLRVKESRKEQGHRRMKTVNIYERSGNLAFQVWEIADGRRRRWADRKTQRFENMLPQCLGGLMMVARAKRIWSEELARRQAEWERESREREEFARLMQQLEKWMEGWNRAKQIREFVAAVEKDCLAKGVSTARDSQKGKWMAWALQQADRFDPLVERSSSQSSAA